MVHARREPVELDSGMDDSLQNLVAQPAALAPRGARRVGRARLDVAHARRRSARARERRVRREFRPCDGRRTRARALALVARAAGELGLEVLTARAASAGRSGGGVASAALELPPQRRSRRAARRWPPRTPATIRSRRCSCARCAAPARAGSRRSPPRARSRDAHAILRPLLASLARRRCGVRRPQAPRVGGRSRRTRARDHLRNRVRHDLLPALTRARPSLPDELLAIGERAARAARSRSSAFVDRELDARASRRGSSGCSRDDATL